MRLQHNRSTNHDTNKDNNTFETSNSNNNNININNNETMMATMFNRGNTNSSSNKTPFFRYDNRSGDFLPDMIESPSNSSGDEGPISPPILYSSSSRMQERFASNQTNQYRSTSTGRERRPRSRPRSRPRQQQQQQSPQVTYSYDELPSTTSKSRSPGRRRRNEGPSDSSILMGANIIKRQLSGDSPTGSLLHSRSQKSPSSRHANNNNGLTSIDNENWDPWLTEDELEEVHKNSKTNSPRGSNDLRDRILEYNTVTRSRVEEILMNGDQYFDDERKAPGNVACAPLEGKDLKKNFNCAVVPRVTEMDNSSFASSSMANGYLPNKLISGLTCGGFNGTLTSTLTSTLTNTLKNNKMASCAAPEEPSGSDLDPTSRQLFTRPTTQARSRSRNRSKSKSSDLDEELETSTLDFLANLHVKEEELGFAFNTPHIELCAQSGMPFLEDPQLRTSESAVSSSSYVTAASVPFEKMLSSRSSLHDQLVKNPAYIHALKAGTLWQSLCTQHVKFPAHWWDGQEPVGPPLGSNKKHFKSWSYLGRHRVQGDQKLNMVIGNRASSGRILLHLIVRDEMTGEPIEDIACGCYHPNARGVRSTQDFDPALEDCRDVWIAHRRRTRDLVFVPSGDLADDKFSWTTIESLLHHQNKGRVHLSPLGAQGGKHSISNKNLRSVFGSKPPVHTVFCMESDLLRLFQTKLDGTIPASVALLRYYLRYQMS